MGLLALGACSDDRPTESDAPAAANLAYPGAVEVTRDFDQGESGEYIDGGSAERAARLTVTYELAGVARDQLFDWYSGELGAAGWTIGARESERVGATLDPPGKFTFAIDVSANPEEFTTYVVRTVIVDGNT